MLSCSWQATDLEIQLPGLKDALTKRGLTNIKSRLKRGGGIAESGYLGTIRDHDYPLQ